MIKLVLAATAVASLAVAPAFAQNTTDAPMTSTHTTHMTHKAKKKHMKHAAMSHSANTMSSNMQ